MNDNNYGEYFKIVCYLHGLRGVPRAQFEADIENLEMTLCEYNDAKDGFAAGEQERKVKERVLETA